MDRQTKFLCTVMKFTTKVTKVAGVLGKIVWGTEFPGGLKFLRHQHYVHLGTPVPRHKGSECRTHSLQSELDTSITSSDNMKVDAITCNLIRRVVLSYVDVV